MTPDQIGVVGKILSIFKDLPAWFLSGLTCAAAILLLVPWVAAQLPPEAHPYLPYLWLIVVFCGCLALFRWLAVGIEALRGWRASRRPKKTFHDAEPDRQKARDQREPQPQCGESPYSSHWRYPCEATIFLLRSGLTYGGCRRARITYSAIAVKSPSTSMLTTI